MDSIFKIAKKKRWILLLYFSNCRIIIIVLHLQYEQHKCTGPLKLDKCTRLYFTWSTYMYIVLISFRFDHLKKKINSVRAADRYYTKVKEQKTLQTTLLDNAFLQPEDQCSRLIEINNIVYYLSIQIILYAILFCCCCCCWFFNTAVICIH